MASENAKAGAHQLPSSSVYPGSLSKDKCGFHGVRFLKPILPPERPKHRPSVKVHHYLPRVVTSPITWTLF